MIAKRISCKIVIFCTYSCAITNFPCSENIETCTQSWMLWNYACLTLVIDVNVQLNKNELKRKTIEQKIIPSREHENFIFFWAVSSSFLLFSSILMMRLYWCLCSIRSRSTVEHVFPWLHHLMDAIVRRIVFIIIIIAVSDGFLRLALVNCSRVDTRKIFQIIRSSEDLLVSRDSHSCIRLWFIRSKRKVNLHSLDIFPFICLFSSQFILFFWPEIQH